MNNLYCFLKNYEILKIKKINLILILKFSKYKLLIFKSSHDPILKNRLLIVKHFKNNL